jgi:hypothetical protein
MHAPPLRRRAALALPAAFGVSEKPAAAQPCPDGEIIRLAEAILADQAECDQLIAPYFHHVVVRYPASVTARLEQLTRRSHEHRQRLSSLRAVTLNGYRAKAKALLTWLAPGGDSDAPEADSDEFLAWSLCRDLCAAGGGEAV